MATSCAPVFEPTTTTPSGRARSRARGKRGCSAGQVHNQVGQYAVGELQNGFDRIFVVEIDDMGCAEKFGQLETVLVAGQADYDNL